MFTMWIIIIITSSSSSSSSSGSGSGSSSGRHLLPDCSKSRIRRNRAPRLFAHISVNRGPWYGSLNPKVSMRLPTVFRQPQSLASRWGRDRRGLHRGATNPPPRFAASCSMCAHVATCCRMSPRSPVKVHQGESRHFCDDPVCPDPVRKRPIDSHSPKESHRHAIYMPKWSNWCQLLPLLLLQCSLSLSLVLILSLIILLLL